MSSSKRGPAAIISLMIGVIIGSFVQPRLTGQPNGVILPVMPRDSGSVSPVVKRVLPAVVSIEGKLNPAARAGQKQQGDTQDPDPGFGSGVLIDPSGVVLTNNHVVLDADSVEVTLADGRKFNSRDIRHDAKSDLAIVKLDSPAPLPFIELADSDAMDVGDRVLAIGAPFGLTGSVTQGIVSGKSRNTLRLNPYEDWLQTDAAVNPGSSGGPLVNLEGRVIGITAAIKTRNGGFTGVGLSVASNLCRNVSTQLLQTGVVKRGYLGTTVLDLDSASAAKTGVNTGGGVLVTRVYDNSPASKGMIQTGDVILSIAGIPVRTPREVQRVATGLPIGGSAEVSIMRNKTPLKLSVKIEEQPSGFGLSSASPQASTPSPILPAPQKAEGPAKVTIPGGKEMNK